jgi:hypothetical protein
VGYLGVNAQSGYSYAFGGEFYLPEYGYNFEDIRQTADYAALMGYHSYYNAYLTYAYVNSQRLNSDLTYFSCHGDANGLYFPNSNLTITRNYSNGSTEVGLSSWTLSYNKLMVFDACSTATGSSNICTTAISRGADCVLGWSEVISTESINWLKRFYNRLATGNTISAAVTYADSFNDYSSDSNLKSHKLYGNGNQILKKSTSSMISVDEKKDSRIHNISEVTFKYTDADYSILEGVIKSQFTDFNLSDYKVTLSSTSEDSADFVVDFNRIINGCWTSSGYTMIFNNNKTSTIYNNTQKESQLRESASFIKASAAEKDTALKEAAKLVGKDENVISQYGENCYDLSTGTSFYRVYTVFGPSDTDYQRVMVYDYKLA